LRGAVGGRGGVLVVRGDPGVGKTALLDHAETASTSIVPEIVVLRAAGLEAEADLAFASLYDLVRQLVHAFEFLADQQRLVLQGAVGMGPPQQADRLDLGAALLELLSAEIGRESCRERVCQYG